EIERIDDERLDLVTVMTVEVEPDLRHATVYVDTPTGAWGCDTVFRCNDVCPKEVRPAHGIEGVRRTLVARKTKRLFRRTS
ncbi:MAG: hypothetical protein ACXVJK_04325, partial [Candidatus Aminicenantales bacterium]